MRMRGFSTFAGQDAWLASLLDAFESMSGRATPVTARMLRETEKHLRDNSRATATGSRLFH